MTRRTFVLLLLLILVAACGCVPSEAADSTWWIHGIAVTESGAPVGGGTVELWRISGNEWALLATRVSASQAWGFEVRQMSARYRVVYVAPVGWRCVSVRSAGVGWQFPGQCTGEIALPEQEPSIGPDLVFVLAPEVTAIPTATRTPMTSTPTPQGTAVAPVPPTLPAKTPPVPTPDPNVGPSATPTFVAPRFQQFTLAEQESIIATAYLNAWHLEPDLALRRYDDQTMILGTRWLNGPPMTRAFEVTDAEGYVIRCRGFVWGIIAMHEKRAGVYQFGVVDWDGGFMKEL